ncbi:MAG: hypothetical protein ACI9Y1_002255 [Lentisphaeria bacterium]|jgi:hypothetical protein
MSDERREHRRFLFQCKTRVALAVHRVIDALTRKISTGAVAFNCSEYIVKGSAVKVELSFTLQGNPVTLRAKVLLVFSIILSDNRGANIGVVFTQIFPTDSSAIASVIDNFSSE